MLVVVDPKILFHYYIITSSLSATVMALTYNPDLVTQTVYDPFKSRYQVTTISYLGFSLFFAIPSVSLDEDNYYTVADFSAYTNYLVSFYSKYRTQ
ncbi:CIC11C00000004258 [Sungouiella intermedia]|uniref:CIC11C00000004258 n=1 Tax=Sungouiella intermedia TaxID=45354 RepID=A0A1L0BHG0_9ASCO|nr:CIC11C00000004258 [[Candida] intermedia]